MSISLSPSVIRKARLIVAGGLGLLALLVLVACAGGSLAADEALVGNSYAKDVCQERDHPDRCIREEAARIRASRNTGGRVTARRYDDLVEVLVEAVREMSEIISRIENRTNYEISEDVELLRQVSATRDALSEAVTDGQFVCDDHPERCGEQPWSCGDYVAEGEKPPIGCRYEPRGASK